MKPAQFLLLLAGAIGVQNVHEEAPELTANCLALSCPDLDDADYSHDALMEAMRTFTGWPSVAAIRSFLIDFRAAQARPQPPAPAPQSDLPAPCLPVERLVPRMPS